MVKKVIKFSAPWCSQCKVYALTFHKVRDLDEFKGIEFTEIDIDESDENEDLAIKYAVRSLPTTILLDEDDKEVGKIIGNVPFDALANEIKDKQAV